MAKDNSRVGEQRELGLLHTSGKGKNHNDPKFLDRHFLANSVEPDHTAPSK